MTALPHPRPVLIVGAGGFGRETASLLRSLEASGWFSVAGFVDDSEELQGRSVAGLPVLGSLDVVKDLESMGVVVTIGNPRNFGVKRVIVRELGLDPARYVTLVHPSASIGSEVSVAEGTVILAGTVITQGVTVGRHVAMMPNVVLTHDDEIGDFVILGAGARLGGGVSVGDGAYIGSGASVREMTRIGAGAMIGMGAVVVDDVPAGETWVGVPARPLPQGASR